jgi:hypothetical protein
MTREGPTVLSAVHGREEGHAVVAVAAEIVRQREPPEAAKSCWEPHCAERSAVSIGAPSQNSSTLGSRRTVRSLLSAPALRVGG